MAGRRSSFGTSTTTVSEAINDSAYDNVKIVADSIGNVNTVSAAIDAGEFDVVTANAADVVTVADNIASVLTTAGIEVEIQSVAADKITLDSIYADKVTLDSIFADKATLDSIFADKATLDSLFTDKAVLDSLYADKAKLDSLYADKIKLDSLYADKATLDSLYNDKTTLDSLYADKIALDRVYTSIDNVDTNVNNIANIDIVADNIVEVNAVGTDIASVITAAANVADITNFADVYQGPKATEPATRNDMTALVEGDMYFDTTTDRLRAYSGAVWITIAIIEHADLLGLQGGATGDYQHLTTDDVSKLAGIEAGAEVNVNADWNGSGDAEILNKPTTVVGYGITDAYTKTEEDALLDTKVDKIFTNTDTVGAGVLVGNNNSEWVKGFTAFTGALQIELTGLYDEASMVGRMKIVLNQAVGDDRVLYIDGRWLNTTHAWDEANVVEMTTASDKLPVRFAKSGDSVFLVIGETTTSWNALRVMIDEVVTNYNASLDLGFVISSTTDLAGLTSDYIKASVDNLYTDTEKSKLLGIEAGAKDDQIASEVPVTPVGNIASTNVQAAIEELDSEKEPKNANIQSHISSTSNPHAVTKTQVGLGNVDNTSDINKPVSTDQQTALDLKADRATTYTKTETYSQAELNGAIGNINSPLLDLPLNNSLAMKQGVGSVNFSRATTATYVDRYGVLKYADIDEPRFEKDGLLIEGASTNLLTYSNDASTFSLVNCTYSTNGTLAPDNSTMAGIFTGNGISGEQFCYIEESGVSTGEKTMSVFLKAVDIDEILLYTYGMGGSGTIYSYSSFAFSTESATNGGFVEKLVNGWYRVTMPSLPITDQTVVQTRIYITSASTSSICVAFPQLEALPFASSYIPTTTSAVTRSADVCSVDVVDNTPSVDNDFTLMCDTSTLGHVSTDNQTIWFIADSLFQNDSNWWAGAENTSLEYYNGNIGGPAGLVQTNTYRFGAILDATTLTRSHSTNGAIDRVSNISLLSYSKPSSFILGSAGASGFLYGHIKNFRIWDKALTAREAALA